MSMRHVFAYDGRAWRSQAKEFSRRLAELIKANPSPLTRMMRTSTLQPPKENAMEQTPAVKRMTSLDAKIAASIQRGEDERKQHARQAQPMGGLTSIASTAGCNIANDPLKPKPTGSVDVPICMQVLEHAMRTDPEFAWTWHCGIAMAYVDQCEAQWKRTSAKSAPEDVRRQAHKVANEAAARFMRSAFNVDTSAEVAKLFPAELGTQEAASRLDETVTDFVKQQTLDLPARGQGVVYTPLVR